MPGKYKNSRLGIVSAAEAVRRISLVMSGPDVMLEKIGARGIWIIAAREGCLLVKQDFINYINQSCYIRVSDFKQGQVASGEVIGSLRILGNIVNERTLHKLESHSKEYSIAIVRGNL